MAGRQPATFPRQSPAEQSSQCRAPSCPTVPREMCSISCWLLSHGAKHQWGEGLWVGRFKGSPPHPFASLPIWGALSITVLAPEGGKGSGVRDDSAAFLEASVQLILPLGEEIGRIVVLEKAWAFLSPTACLGPYSFY